MAFFAATAGDAAAIVDRWQLPPDVMTQPKVSHRPMSMPSRCYEGNATVTTNATRMVHFGDSGLQSPAPSICALVRKVLRSCQLFFMCAGIVPSSRTLVTW